MHMQPDYGPEEDDESKEGEFNAIRSALPEGKETIQAAMQAQGAQPADANCNSGSDEVEMPCVRQNGDSETGCSIRVVLNLKQEIQEAYQQLAYLWNQTGSCPCGARKGSPRTHPHVTNCPTAKATAIN